MKTVPVSNTKSRNAKHQAILESATELLLFKPNATLQEIANYSNIGIATLHRHFLTKERLLDALAINAIELVKQAFEGITYDNENLENTLFNLFNALIPLGDKISFLGAAISVDENPVVSEGENALKEFIIQILDKWKSKGILNNNISSRWMVSVMYNLLFLAWQEIRIGNLAKNDAPHLLITTVLNGFSK